MKTDLTPAQLKEEVALCVKNKVLTADVWTEVDAQAYLHMSRVGQSFRLNRMERCKVAGQVWEGVQARLRASRPVSMLDPETLKLEEKLISVWDEFL